MAYKTGAKGNSRDFGLNGGAPGKGDKDRTNNRSAFVKHFNEIKFTGVKFVKHGTKLIKRYS